MTARQRRCSRNIGSCPPDVSGYRNLPVTLNAFIKQEATRERTTSGWQECIVTLVYRLTIWQQEGYLFHSTLGFDSRHQQTPMTRVDVKYVKRASFVLFFGILHLKETASQPDRDCQHTKKTWMLIHLSFITLGLRPPQNWHHRGFFRSLTLFHKVSSCVFFWLLPFVTWFHVSVILVDYQSSLLQRRMPETNQPQAPPMIEQDWSKLGKVAFWE